MLNMKSFSSINTEIERIKDEKLGERFEFVGEVT